MFEKVQAIAKKIKRVTKFGQLLADTAAYFHDRGVELGIWEAEAEVK